MRGEPGEAEGQKQHPHCNGSGTRACLNMTIPKDPLALRVKTLGMDMEVEGEGVVADLSIVMTLTPFAVMAVMEISEKLASEGMVGTEESLLPSLLAFRDPRPVVNQGKPQVIKLLV